MLEGSREMFGVGAVEGRKFFLADPLRLGLGAVFPPRDFVFVDRDALASQLSDAQPSSSTPSEGER